MCDVRRRRPPPPSLASARRHPSFERMISDSACVFVCVCLRPTGSHNTNAGAHQVKCCQWLQYEPHTFTHWATKHCVDMPNNTSNNNKKHGYALYETNQCERTRQLLARFERMHEKGIQNIDVYGKGSGFVAVLLHTNPRHVSAHIDVAAACNSRGSECVCVLVFVKLLNGHCRAFAHEQHTRVRTRLIIAPDICRCLLALLFCVCCFVHSSQHKY